ncbi:CobW family GTP-binding protein [Ectobacillus polymachus]|uniref:CobW family GTP-binding protein n=1 Tax=Ectobacillus polymachus TaxID=1508806 RepID=UPI003A856176
MKQIPVYILSGFLGSGKTTVLLHLLEYYRKQNERPAIILNELGKVNVERHLFSEERVNELLDGCICCSMQSNFRGVLNQLADNCDQIDVLIIEGTGVANPIELVEVLTASPYRDFFSLQSIIGIVDAARFLEYINLFLSSSSMRALFKDQIKCSSFLVLNKIDAVSEKKLQTIELKLQSFIGESVPVYKTSYGQVEAEELLQKRMITSVTLEEKHHHHHGTIQAIRLEAIPPLDRKKLKEWFHSISEYVYRAKGVLRIAEKPELYELQYASGSLKINAMYIDDGTVSSNLILIGEEDAAKNAAQSFKQQFLS